MKNTWGRRIGSVLALLCFAVIWIKPIGPAQTNQKLQAEVVTPVPNDPGHGTGGGGGPI